MYFRRPLKPEEELVLLEQLGGEEDVTVKSVLIELKSASGGLYRKEV